MSEILRPLQSARRTPLAFDFLHLEDAKKRLPRHLWREEFDRELQYYVREYLLQEHVTSYRYGILKDSSSGRPFRIFNPTNNQEDALESFKRGVDFAVTPTLRERAQADCVGFDYIRQQIFSGRICNRWYVWTSPPGQKEDGFETHTFTHVGHVLDDKVEVVSYKNWLPANQHINFLNQYLEPERKLQSNASDLDILTRPVMLPETLTFSNHLQIISLLDPQRGDLQEGDCSWLLNKLSPFRRAIIAASERGNFILAQRFKNGLDNYCLALLRGEDKDIEKIAYWAAKRPVSLRGSCGFSGALEENDASSSWFGAESKYFNCPRCKGKIESGKGIVVCPHCGAKKEEYKACN